MFAQGPGPDRCQRLISGLLLLLAAAALPRCDALRAALFGEAEQPDQLLPALAFLLYPPQEHYARLYYADAPLISLNPTNASLLREATPADVRSGRKQLVLISGWDASDPVNPGYPDLLALQQRALVTNWGQFTPTVQFLALYQNHGFDIFIFDYLTSDGVDNNGARFRNRLDRVFGAASGARVYVFAHSMGGLVSRFMLYQGDAAPSYLRAIVSSGTPYHGSPWASPQFQGDRLLLGSLASFLTGTAGGRDLAYDNFDGQLQGASNPKLSLINARSERDSYIHAFAGTAGAIGAETYAGDSDSASILRTACSVLRPFGDHDCVVTLGSQYLSGGAPAHTEDLGNYDHFDINMKNNTVRSRFETYLSGLP